LTASTPRYLILVRNVLFRINCRVTGTISATIRQSSVSKEGKGHNTNASTLLINVPWVVGNRVLCCLCRWNKEHEPGKESSTQQHRSAHLQCPLNVRNRAGFHQETCPLPASDATQTPETGNKTGDDFRQRCNATVQK
jgi:hypothetical protein